MSTSLRFRDHAEFHRAALHMGVAGALAGLAAHVAGLVFPGAFTPAGPWAVAALTGAAAFGAASPRTRARLGELGRLLVLAAAGGLALKLLGGRGPEPSLGALVFGLTFGLLVARGSGGRRFLLTVAAGAGVALVARWVLVKFVTAPELSALPPWLLAALAGGAFAFVGVVAILPRHLELSRDRVGDAWEATRGRLSGEVHELADRAMSVWTRVDASLEQGSPVRRAIEDSVLRLFDVARRWQEVEADGARTSADALVDRMEQVERKIEATDDAIARRQYEQARAALGEQLRYLREIATSRERVVARMHHYLAAMERLRFAVVSSRSADASRLSQDVQPILDDLADLGKEIDCTTEAMGEAERLQN